MKNKQRVESFCAICCNGHKTKNSVFCGNGFVLTPSVGVLLMKNTSWRVCYFKYNYRVHKQEINAVL